jgi:hypothetical protein
MGPVRTQRCPLRLHALRSHASAPFSACEANASSSLLARFSPHLELSRQGEPPSVQGLCCREMMIEGQEQLPPPARVWRGVRVPPSTMLAFRWSGSSGRHGHLGRAATRHFWRAARLDGELAALKARPWWRRLAD